MFTRRPMTHQQQQPKRDRIAQAQQQAGSSDFQPQVGSTERPVPPGRCDRSARPEWKTQH
jgi:hypothetical protein